MAKKIAPKPITPKKHKHAGHLLLKKLIYEDAYTAGFYLYVYDTQDEMKKGIEKWHDENGLKFADMIDCVGLCIESPYYDEVKDNDGREVVVFAHVFLTHEALCVGTIAHECLHATITFERKMLRYEGGYGDRLDNGNDEEERLCYRCEAFVDLVIRACIDADLHVRLNEL
jgi:hypothetical protein